MAISTNGTIITRLAGALYGEYLSNASYTELNTTAAATVAANMLTNDFAGKTDSQVAKTVLANLGLSSITGLDNWVAAQLTAAGSTAAAKGAKLATMLNDYAMMTADATYGTYAVSFNSKVAAALTASQATGSTGGAFGTVDAIPSSITLTTGVDNKTGGAGSDTFDGSLNASGIATFQASDVINGGAGTDTLIVGLAPATATTLTPANISNVEVLSVTNTGAGALTLALAEVSGLTQLGVTAGSGDVSFTGVLGLPAVRVESNTGAVTINHNVTSLAGKDDNQTITLSSSGTGAAPVALTVNRSSSTSANVIETVTLETTDAASGVSLTLLSSLGATKLAVKGSQNLNLTGLTDAANTVATIDASAMTGSFVMGSGTSADYTSTTGTNSGTFNTAAKITVLGGSGNDTIIGSTGNDSLSGGAGNDGFYMGQTSDDYVDGGAGDDTFYVGTALTYKDTIVAGDGTDTLNLGAVATTGSTRSALNVSGIETVTLNFAATTQDMAAFDSTVNRVNLSQNSTYTLTNASASVATVGISSTSAALTSPGVSVSRATDTAADALSVSVGSGSYTYAMTGVSITANNEESLTISAAGKATSGVYPAHTVTTLAASSATSLTATGAADLAVSNVTAPALTTINAGAMTGAFTMSAAVNNLNDTITGGAGNDSLIGGTGNDVIDTGAGNNTVNASDGKNSITGGAGNDSITSGSGNDTITAGAGNDNITPGAGTDSIDAGDGTDAFFMSGVGTSSDFSSSDVIDGGAGTDTVYFTAATTLTDTLAARLKNVEVLANGSASGAASITLTDAVMAANGVTSLTVRNYGLASATATSSTYGTGALTVDAGGLTSGANTVAITVSADSGSTPAHSLVGGSGNDAFTFNYRSTSGAPAPIDSTVTVAGGQGTDTMTLNGATIGVAISATLGSGVSGIEKLVIGSNAAATTVTTNDANLGAYESMTVDATAMTSTGNTFTFNASGETQSTASYNVSVGSGGSSVTGGAGNDSMTGGLGADTLSGGDGRDSLSGGAGNDSLIGGAGNDSLDGGTGDDALDGGAGNDVITAGAGNDTILSGAGADAITGGDGNDVYSYNITTDSLATGSVSSTVTSQASLDTITGFDAGGGTAATVVDKISTSVDITTIQTASLTSSNNTSLGGDLAANATLAAAATGSATVVTVAEGTAAGTYLVLNNDGTTGYQAASDTVIKLVDAANLTKLTTSNFSVGVGPSATASSSGFTLTSQTGAVTNLTGYSTTATANAAGITAVIGSSGTDTINVSGEAASKAISFNFATGVLTGATAATANTLTYLNMDTFTGGNEANTVTDGSRSETITLGTDTNVLTLSGGGTDSVTSGGVLTATVSASSGTATITHAGTGTASVTVSGAQTIVLDAEESGSGTTTLTMSRALTTSDSLLADSGDTSKLVLNTAQGSTAFTLSGTLIKAVDTIELGASGGAYNLTTEAGNATATIQAASTVVLGNVTVDASATTNALSIDLTNGATYTGASTVTFKGNDGSSGAAAATFDGGSGVDAVTVVSYYPGTNATLNIGTGAGADTITVSAIAGAITADDIAIDGGADSDTLTIAQLTTAIVFDAGDVKNIESFITTGSTGNFTGTFDEADLATTTTVDVRQTSAATSITLSDTGSATSTSKTLNIKVIQDAGDSITVAGASSDVVQNVTIKLTAAAADTASYSSADFAIALGSGTTDSITFDIAGLTMTGSMTLTTNGDADGAETINIVNTSSTGGKMMITIDDAGTTNLTNFNASTLGASDLLVLASGDFANAGAAITISGGAGNDDITTTSGTAVSTINLSTGTDTLQIIGVTAAKRALVTGFTAGASGDILRLEGDNTSATTADAANLAFGADNDGGAVTIGNSADVMELGFDFATVGDLSSATDGSALLAGLTSLAFATDDAKGYVIAYQGTTAYLFFADDVNTSTDSDSGVLQATEIALVGVFYNVAVGAFIAANTIIV